jgi:hypothetical protein
MPHAAVRRPGATPHKIISFQEKHIPFDGVSVLSGVQDQGKNQDAKKIDLASAPRKIEKKSLQGGGKYDNIRPMRNTRPISWIKALEGISKNFLKRYKTIC